MFNSLVQFKENQCINQIFFFKQAESKKNSLCAFLRKLLAFKSDNQCQHRSNRVAPLQPVCDTDSADPQPGPSGLQPTALQDQTDSQPGRSSVKPTSCDANPDDPEAAEGRSTVILILYCFFSHLSVGIYLFFCSMLVNFGIMKKFILGVLYLSI